MRKPTRYSSPWPCSRPHPDGGDDIAAAAALAKCLLPGACRLAGWLSSLPTKEVFRDSQPIQAGAWWAVERIDELVASQLWIEVRSFPWRRLTKVASNIIVSTKVGVLREVGDYFYVTRADRTQVETKAERRYGVPSRDEQDHVAGSDRETSDPEEPATHRRGRAAEDHDVPWATPPDALEMSGRLTSLLR